jgi:hypothetical protein
MKKHNKPEWVEGIQKEKLDLKVRKQYMKKLIASLRVIDLNSIDVNIYERATSVHISSSRKSPYTTVIKEYYLMKGFWSQPLIEWFFQLDSPGYRKKIVPVERSIDIDSMIDGYCFKFIQKTTDCGVRDKKCYKHIFSNQMISLLEEKPLETNKIYDMYKWLTYNTDHIPTIGEVKTINKVNKADVKPIILILVASFIAIFILYLGMT